MSDALRRALRSVTPAPARRVGERAHEAGRVALAGRDTNLDGWSFAVTLGSGRFDVELWPGDAEWECDCEAPTDGCAHAWAATLALADGTESLAAAAAPARLVMLLKAGPHGIHLDVAAARGEQMLELGAAIGELTIGTMTRHLMKLSGDWAGDRIPGRSHKLLLASLLEADEVRLNGDPITVSQIPLDVVARAEPTGAGWRLSLTDPDGVDATFKGDPVLLLSEGILRPRGFGKLTQLQQHKLRVPLLFRDDEVPRLTAEWLPALAKAITVIRSDGLPEVQAGGLRTELSLIARGPVLEASVRVVYGDPAVAEVIGQEIFPLGGMTRLPVRNRRAERDAITRLDAQLGLRPGQRVRLEGERAVRFVQNKLPAFKGHVAGKDAAKRFKLKRKTLEPVVSWGEKGLHVSFRSGGAAVGADRVLEAYHSGSGVVALQGEGWARLPGDWLDEHGSLLAFASSGSGRHLAPAAAQLLESVGAEPPPDLRDLVDALRDGVPDLDPPEALEAELRPYQQDGYRWLQFLAAQGLGGVLADDMGLGKTVQTIASLLADRGHGPSLVVAPTSVLRNWESETARFAPDLAVAVLHGKGRANIDLGKQDVVITSYALMRLDGDRLAKVRWRTVVLDEAQAIKNADSQTAKAARRLNAERRLALTGTPIENHLRELWSLFEFLNPGFFGTRKRFDERFGTGSPAAFAALRARVRPFVLRRLKSEVAKDLPPRTETVLRCAMSEPQRAAYEQVRTGAQGLTERMQVLAALTRLRQAACDAALLPDGPEAPSGKLDVLMDALETVADEGGRALVFSQWTSLLDRVEPRLQGASLDWVRLDGSTRDRGAVVDQFQAADGPPVFLVSLKAGGTGLNLTAADHVFLLDPWWNPAAEQQAVDRAHRIGQDKPVFVWKLVTADSVEERVLALQARKQAMADAVLEGADAALRLTDDDLAALLC
ncbi:MAG: DEAD/DEAH box helicase [Proteobacteria bacterium]|nr:DEAD/DEAH box helicase [Pseudomonadota bacterium]